MATVLRVASLTSVTLLAVGCYGPTLVTPDAKPAAVDAGAADATAADGSPPPPDGSSDAGTADAAPCALAGCNALSCGDGVCRVECVATSVTWDVAESACRTWGGTLVEIDGAAENECVVGTVSRWIGLNDVALEDTFVWADGTPVGSYQPWNTDEPDDLDGTTPGADCVRMLPTSGLWSDEDCDSTYGYVCERP
jgi:hypothetical protein